MALGRYTGPTARLIAERLSDGRPKFSGGWYRVRGVCHKGDPRPDGGSLSLRDGRDRLIVHCFKDCDRRTVIEALESSTGWTIWNRGSQESGGLAEGESTASMEPHMRPDSAAGVSLLRRMVQGQSGSQVVIQQEARPRIGQIAHANHVESPEHADSGRRPPR